MNVIDVGFMTGSLWKEPSPWKMGDLVGKSHDCLLGHEVQRRVRDLGDLKDDVRRARDHLGQVLDARRWDEKADAERGLEEATAAWDVVSAEYEALQKAVPQDVTFSCLELIPEQHVMEEFKKLYARLTLGGVTYFYEPIEVH